jgi:hypothetical protein
MIFDFCFPPAHLVEGPAEFGRQDCPTLRVLSPSIQGAPVQKDPGELFFLKSPFTQQKSFCFNGKF